MINYITPFEDIKFFEENHTYVFGGKIRPSVTGVLKKLSGSRPFDAYAESIKCSQGFNPKYVGRSPEEIRKMWSDKSKASTDRGTAMHRFIECSLKSIKYDLLYEIPTRDVNDVVEVLNVLTKMGVKLIDTELRVGSIDFNLCGSLDYLGEMKSQPILIDWKSNLDKDLNEVTRWTTSMSHPFGHITDNALGSYNLQLHTYDAILMKEVIGHIPSRKFVVHFTGSGWRIYEIPHSPETINGITDYLLSWEHQSK